MLQGQQANFRGQAAVAQLRAIGVVLPAHATEQIPVAQTKRDQVAATAMIWSEDKFSRLQFSKGFFNIDRAKTRAVAADHDNFVVAKLIDFLDRIFQPRSEVPPDLPVSSRSAYDWTTA